MSSAKPDSGGAIIATCERRLCLLIGIWQADVSGLCNILCVRLYASSSHLCVIGALELHLYTSETKWPSSHGFHNHPTNHGGRLGWLSQGQLVELHMLESLGS